MAKPTQCFTYFEPGHTDQNGFLDLGTDRIRFLDMWVFRFIFSQGRMSLTARPFRTGFLDLCRIGYDFLFSALSLPRAQGIDFVKTKQKCFAGTTYSALLAYISHFSEGNRLYF